MLIRYPHAQITFVLCFFYILTDIHCETNIDECASAPCQNEGICHDYEAGYVCTCQLGYFGEYDN